MSGNGTLLKNDLASAGFNRSSEFLEPDAPVLFDVCLVGTPDGFAQEFSKSYEATVTAAKESISPNSIAVSRNNGKVAIDIEYDVADSKVLYRNGTKIK